MQFCGRAYYNLLMMNPGACGVDAPHWQCEDYRGCSDEELFQRLSALGVDLSEEGLSDLVLYLDTPEEIKTQFSCGSDDEAEQIYLLFFELWRRLFPDKQSLSIFCDELDRLVMEYQSGEASSEKVAEMVLDLERVLDENFDHGVEPQEVFGMVRLHMAHDLESFLFDFITLQIKNHNEQYASELIEDFYPYVERDHWFDFLRVRLTSLLDSEEASYMLGHLLDKLEEKQDKQLLFEALEFLISFGESASYLSIFSMLLRLIDSKQDYVDLVGITKNYFKQYALDLKELNTIGSDVAGRESVTSEDLNQLREITLTGLKSI